MTGKLIVIDGPDGSGKSTLTNGLEAYLQESRRPYVRVREPGSTELGEYLRELLLSFEHISPKAEALLFAASRAQLVKEKIRPALEEGKIVLCDRYILSSVAYQGAGRGLGENVIHRLNTWATDGLTPDVTFLLVVSPEEGLFRQAKNRDLDRMETAGDAFHRLVVQAYEKGASDYPDQKVIFIDGTRSKQEVLTVAIEAIEHM